MKKYTIIGIMLLIGFWGANLRADIYSWTDENGVVHFTNYNPPKKAKIILKAPEIIYDVNALQESREIEEQDSYLFEIQKIADQQTMITRRQQAIEDKVDAANRKAEQVLERSQDLLDDAQSPVSNGNDLQDDVGNDITDTTYKRSYISYGYFPYYPYDRYNSSFRHGGLKHRHLRYYRHGKRHFGHRKNYHYRHSIRHYSGHFSKHYGRKFYHGSRHQSFRGKGRHFKGHFRGGHRFKGHFRGSHRGYRGGRR